MTGLNHDPTPDLYQLMDEAGLTQSGLYNSKKPMAKIINEVRTALAQKTRSYIQRRDQTMHNAGFQKGAKHD